MMERINKVMSLESKYINLDFNERIKAIANDMGISETMVYDCIVLKHNILTNASLNAAVGDEDDSELADLVVSDEEPSLDEKMETNELREMLELAMSTLSDKEIDILKLRYGLKDNVGFDKKFIDKAYSDSGISADYDYVDTLALSRDEMPNSKNHKLSTIARDLDIEQEEDHRALADARTAGRVYSVLNKRR
jgi:hypothetical protein